jgi:hypothetical protein
MNFFSFKFKFSIMLTRYNLLPNPMKRISLEIGENVLFLVKNRTIVL